jgi:hypothetical protein
MDVDSDDDWSAEEISAHDDQTKDQQQQAVDSDGLPDPGDVSNDVASRTRDDTGEAVVVDPVICTSDLNQEDISRDKVPVVSVVAEQELERVPVDSAELAKADSNRDSSENVTTQNNTATTPIDKSVGTEWISVESKTSGTGSDDVINSELTTGTSTEEKQPESSNLKPLRPFSFRGQQLSADQEGSRRNAPAAVAVTELQRMGQAARSAEQQQASSAAQENQLKNQLISEQQQQQKAPTSEQPLVGVKAVAGPSQDKERPALISRQTSLGSNLEKSKGEAGSLVCKICSRTYSARRDLFR